MMKTFTEFFAESEQLEDRDLKYFNVLRNIVEAGVPRILEKIKRVKVQTNGMIYHTFFRNEVALPLNAYDETKHKFNGTLSINKFAKNNLNGAILDVLKFYKKAFDTSKDLKIVRKSVFSTLDSLVDYEFIQTVDNKVGAQYHLSIELETDMKLWRIRKEDDEYFMNPLVKITLEKIMDADVKTGVEIDESELPDTKAMIKKLRYAIITNYPLLDAIFDVENYDEMVKFNGRTAKAYKISKKDISPEKFSIKLTKKYFGNLLEDVLKTYIEKCKKAYRRLKEVDYHISPQVAEVSLVIPSSKGQNKQICYLAVTFTNNNNTNTIHPYEDYWELKDSGDEYLVRPCVSITADFTDVNG